MSTPVGEPGEDAPDGGRAPPTWGSLPGGRPGLGTAAATETPTLDFSVEDGRVAEHAAVPSLCFDLRIDPGPWLIRSLSLNVQVRIDAPRRGYDAGEESRLYELFGAPRDWGRSLRGLLWAQTSFVVPVFEGPTVAELAVPCSYDFDVAANKYLHAVRGGSIPLEFLFSGSVFYSGPQGALRTVRLPWDRECRWDMPAQLWHRMMERYFSDSAWVRLRLDIFDRLHAFRADQGHPTWEATLDALLPDGDEDL